jgi:feruloyl-CoA synthase
VKDAVIAGQDRDSLAAILLPEREACAGVADLAARLEQGLAQLAASATGSSNRITRAVLLDAPLSLDAGEITDKGSINQRAVLAQRAALVQRLYADPPGPDIIRLAEITA